MFDVRFFLTLLLFSVAAFKTNTQPLAFPGAEGCGRFKILKYI